ncbi:MAG: tRNA pseudouridine(13) synthase TruD, partial [Leptonema sp. (in: Bacteria)]|nr:tRNA pseudouridine(13) synthase TruD [Leptonema sp. (in: bacteria)]
MNQFDSLPYIYGEPPATGKLKVEPADFLVEEVLPFDLSGSGEHLWLWIEKEGENTDWVAQQLAKSAHIRVRDVGYAGLKDRHAITRQWFSLYLPGKENPTFENLAISSIEGVSTENQTPINSTIRILKQIRHNRKLHTGALQSNRFTILLRQITGDQSEIEERLTTIKREGVANYFGEQRFGKEGKNLDLVDRLFAGELTRLKSNKRGLIISSARSYLFNLILAERVSQNNWNQSLTGDAFQLEGSDKWFVDDNSNNLADRVNQKDIHPTGALFGEGDLPVFGECKNLEEKVLSNHQSWCQSLADLGLKQDRRSLRLWP